MTEARAPKSATVQVFKFGGSSLGSVGRLAAVLQRVEEGLAQGPLLLVVSALGDTTDWLLSVAQRAAEGDTAGAELLLFQVHSLALDTAQAVLSPQELVRFEQELTALLLPTRRLAEGVGLVRECSPRTLDGLIAVGERISAALVARALVARGVPALAVDARELILTDDTPQGAQVLTAETQRLVASAAAGWAGKVPVITGFIGRSRAGHTTTLGRNGSDYTASLIAQAVGATDVTAWTDVPGVFTADPALVSEAYPVRALSYFEALELAHFGTRMFHARTVVPLLESNATLHIKSTLAPEDPGTRIDALGSREDSQPTCVTSLERLALLSIEARRSQLPRALVSRALEALEAAQLKVWMTNQTGLGVSATFVVSHADAAAARAVLEGVCQPGEAALGATRGPVSLVTLVAERMGRQANIAGRFFSALGNVGIPVRAIAQGASERSISCVVEAADTAAAVRTVHAAFNFAETFVHVALLGHGTVGGQLLAQVAQQEQVLRTEHGVRVKLVGLVDSSAALFDAEGLEPGRALAQLPKGKGPRDEALVAQLSRLPLPVLVDCTAADGMQALYARAFEQGIHVVGANKKPLALPWAEREALLGSARRHHRAYLYETTCGASLPVIETLKNLVRTGDAVRRIEGSLSGTLGYLSDALMQGVPLSVAVREARDKGLTEPHPRDDLSGLDVGRKALILARELGAPLELSAVAIEPFVPRHLLEEPNVEAFLRGLESIDRELGEQVARYRKEGKVLRFLAQVEAAPGSPVRVKVGPVAVDARHPAASLQGEEAMVAFTTRRYEKYPLIVRGAGAGGDVTAAGVLADILRIADQVRGRR